MSLKRCLTGFILAAIAITAAAFERPFPPQAKRGSFSSAEYPTVVIDGQLRKLSMGGSNPHHRQPDRDAGQPECEWRGRQLHRGRAGRHRSDLDPDAGRSGPTGARRDKIAGNMARPRGGSN
ncbi:hypothetical protein ACFS07_05615 [Undibacterium arcticum]